MSGLSKILFALGLVFLMLVKVSALHVYEHSDENQHHHECHLCDLAMENQVAELHFSPQIEFSEAASIVIQNTVFNNCSKSFTDNSYKFGLFSRPPPTRF